MSTKSIFRTTVEGAMLNANALNILSASHVFVDRNKYSDRIKFAFKDATPEQIADITNEVRKCYPDNHVTVQNNRPAHYCGWGGMSVSVAHMPGVKL